MEKIQFRCASCGRTLAIDAKHAGKVAPCPGCQASLTIPAASEAAEPLPSPAAPVPPLTSDPPATPVNPFSLDAETMPNAGPAAADMSSLGAMPAAGLDDSPKAAAPTQPAAAKTSFGKSLAGLAVAILVAGVFTVLWLVVGAVTGSELGILAWGLGGAVGLVAGVIAKNPSKVYCGLVAAIAVMSVLAAKGIMVAMIMAMSWGADMLIDLADMSPERHKLVAAMADQMLSDGQFDGLEKEYAELYVASFFAGSGELYEEMTEEMYAISDDVDSRIRDELKTKNPEQEQELLAAARSRHPEWIEDHNHYLAAVDEMLGEEGTLSDDLAAHAKSEMAPLDGSWDQEYYKSVAPAEIAQRRLALRKLAAERINSQSESEREQAVRNAMVKHPSWTPYPEAYTAMMEKMHREGTFSGPLAEHAKATIESELTDEYPDYFDNISENDSEAREKELRIAVNEKLSSSDAAAREALIADTKTRYPDWYAGSMPADEAQEELQEALDEIGTDGTFLGSLRAVFTPFDILWLFLGATTAFGSAHKYGTSE